MIWAASHQYGSSPVIMHLSSRSTSSSLKLAQRDDRLELTDVRPSSASTSMRRGTPNQVKELRFVRYDASTYLPSNLKI